MVQSFAVMTAETPFGAMMLAETSDEYSSNMAREYEQLTYEEPVVDAIRASKADLFIDGGAGFGYFSLLAASMGMRVVAFEPHPVRYGYLWWNTRNALPHIETLNRGLAGSNGSISIDITTHVNGLICKSQRTQSYHMRMETSSIDSVLRCTPHDKALIKLDIEGWEDEVITCCEEVRVQSNTDWIIEFHTDLVDVDGLLRLFPMHDKQILHSRDRYNTVTYLLRSPSMN